MQSKAIYRRTELDVSNASDLNTVGSYMTIGDKTYKWVQNKTAGATAVGDVVCYAAGTDATLTKVYASATANLNLMAGVCTAIAAADDYMWIQVYGYSASINTQGHASSAIGDAMVAVNATTYCTRGTALGTAPIYQFHIIALQVWATVSADLKKGFIKCM